MACEFWLTYQNAEIMPVAILLSRATAKVLIAVWWMSGLDWAWKKKNSICQTITSFSGGAPHNIN